MRLRLNPLIDRTQASLFLVPLMAVMLAIALASVASVIDSNLDQGQANLLLAIYALLAGSRHLMTGPDASIAAIMATTIGPLSISSGVAPLELGIGMSALVGVIIAIFWAFQTGSVVRYLSKAVLVGFIAGLSIEVLTSQIAGIMNVSVHAEGWIREVVALVRAVPRASAASVAVGVVTVLLLKVIERFAPRTPAALLALVAVTVTVVVTDPGGVETLGKVPRGLPGLTVPTFGLDVWLQLVPVALIIVALTVTEGLMIAKSYAVGDATRFRPNSELFALAASNIAGAGTGAMPSGASESRTAAVAVTGSGTQVPSLVAAGLVAALLVAARGLITDLPQAALAGLVASAVVPAIDMVELKRSLGCVEPSSSLHSDVPRRFSCSDR